LGSAALSARPECCSRLFPHPSRVHRDDAASFYRLPQSVVRLSTRVCERLDFFTFDFALSLLFRGGSVKHRTLLRQDNAAS